MVYQYHSEWYTNITQNGIPICVPSGKSSANFTLQMGGLFIYIFIYQSVNSVQ